MGYRGIVLDVDGTVVRGDKPIVGATEGLAAAGRHGLQRLFVSNNPTRPPADYVDRLGRAGFDVAEREVVTATTVVRRYLDAHHRDDDLRVIGKSGLVDQLRAAGFSVVGEDESADALVVSIDPEFDYDRLCEAMWRLEDESVAFVGTDPDLVIPAASRSVPGSGAMIRAVASVAGREPDAVLGKPSPQARDLILDRLGLPQEACLVVGDRLDTDIALGAAAGMTTVLVRTGIADRTVPADCDVTPDHVVDSLSELGTILDAGG